MFLEKQKSVLAHVTVYIKAVHITLNNPRMKQYTYIFFGLAGLSAETGQLACGRKIITQALQIVQIREIKSPLLSCSGSTDFRVL